MTKECPIHKTDSAWAPEHYQFGESTRWRTIGGLATPQRSTAVTATVSGEPVNFSVLAAPGKIVVFHWPPDLVWSTHQEILSVPIGSHFNLPPVRMVNLG